MGRLANGLRAAAFGLAALVCADSAAAQTAVPRSDVLVLNQERLLSQTEYGARIQEELEIASRALAAENRRIEEQLTSEELELTELRQTLPADEFRVLADEFDARVTGIRQAQDAKARDLQAQADLARQGFFEDTVPILLDLVEDRGAAVLLDSRTVFLSAGEIDITDAAIALIDERLGNGGEGPLISVPGLSLEPVEE